MLSSAWQSRIKLMVLMQMEATKLGAIDLPKLGLYRIVCITMSSKVCANVDTDAWEGGKYQMINIVILGKGNYV